MTKKQRNRIYRKMLDFLKSGAFIDVVLAAKMEEGYLLKVMALLEAIKETE